MTTKQKILFHFFIISAIIVAGYLLHKRWFRLGYEKGLKYDYVKSWIYDPETGKVRSVIEVKEVNK